MSISLVEVSRGSWRSPATGTAQFPEQLSKSCCLFRKFPTGNEEEELLESLAALPMQFPAVRSVPAALLGCKEHTEIIWDPFPSPPRVHLPSAARNLLEKRWHKIFWHHPPPLQCLRFPSSFIFPPQAGNEMNKKS